MATIWPFIPAAIGEQLKFYTDVRRARSGEFRDSLHDAVQVLSFTYVESDDNQASLIEETFRNNLTGDWLVPLWYDFTELSAGLNASDTVIAVQDGDFRSSGKALVFADSDSYEIVDVDVYSGGTLYLNASTPVSQSYPPGVLVVPLLTSIAPFGLDRDLRIGPTDFGLQFYVTDPKDLADTFYPTYNNFDILRDGPAIESVLSGGVSQRLDFIDNNFGAFEIVTEETYVRYRSNVQFVDVTTLDRWRRREFLHRCRGQDRPFWLPSFKADLNPQEGLTPFETGVTVDLDSVADIAQLVNRYVYIWDTSTDNNITVRRVISALGSVLTLDNGPNFLVTQNNLRMGFAHLVRFDADTFDIEHIRTSDGWFSRFQAPVVGVVQ